MNAPQILSARVVPGHQVASGQNGDPRFPGGTLKMQASFFREAGLDLSCYFGGTINVRIAPCTYQVVRAPLTLWQVKWHPVEPAEDFSFFDVRVRQPEGGAPVDGKIYYPHPDTKPDHFQSPDVLELLLPYLKGIAAGSELILEMDPAQILVSCDARLGGPLGSPPEE